MALNPDLFEQDRSVGAPFAGFTGTMPDELNVWLVIRHPPPRLVVVPDAPGSIQRIFSFLFLGKPRQEHTLSFLVGPVAGPFAD